MYRFLFLLCSLVVSFSLTAQQEVVWVENFEEEGCDQGNLADLHFGGYSLWIVEEIGANGNSSNNFYVSGMASNTGVGNCAVECGANANPSLHIGAGDNVLTPADPGALYLESDALTCDFFNVCAETNKRIHTTPINMLSRTGLELSFLYFEGGNAQDNAQLWINIDDEWSVLSDLPKTTNCASGTWTSFSIALPEAANDNAFQLGFSWSNNGDGIATDPSFAVDDMVLTADPAEEPDNCPFDLNGDTFIDGADLIILLAAFGCLNCPDVDTNNSGGFIDSADVVGFLSAFGGMYE